jgi:hypothetical protein
MPDSHSIAERQRQKCHDNDYMDEAKPLHEPWETVKDPEDPIRDFKDAYRDGAAEHHVP